MTPTRVQRGEGRAWQATCPDCGWSYRSTILERAHTEATHHTCKPTLGPRHTPGVTFGDASSMPIGVAQVPRGFWGGDHRLEVW